jgi:outer membrane protein assembly factor BamB
MKEYLVGKGLVLTLIFLFMVSVITPITLGYNIRIPIEKSIQTTTMNDGPMDSAWPMFQYDIRHTGRSPYGKSGNWHMEKWKFKMDGSVYSSSVIDRIGTVYIGGWNNFYAINPNGSLKWIYEFKYGWVESAAAIDDNGNLYFGTAYADNNYIYALYSNGTLKWKYLTGNHVKSSPAIGNDGTIYFGSDNENIYALYPNGTIRWKYKTGGVVHTSPAIGNDGIIYCGSQDGCLYALYPNGTEKWKYNIGCWIGRGPTIADDGTIYFSGVQEATLYALYPDGTYKWHVYLGVNVVSTPALAEDGTIYVASYKEGGGAYINSISPNGFINWRYEVEDEAMSASPVIDKYGIIYIGGWRGNNEVGGNLYALNPDGTLRWVFHTGDSIHSSAAIGEDGTIYIGSWDEYLYAIEPVTDDNAPDTPSINGPRKGMINTNYTYIAVTTDADGDNVSYYFDWGDGTNSGWTSYVPSGSSVNLVHSWQKSGFYVIKVKAKDDYGKESDWAILIVRMPKDKFVNFNLLFFKLLEQFPLLERLLYFLK